MEAARNCWWDCRIELAGSLHPELQVVVIVEVNRNRYGSE